VKVSWDEAKNGANLRKHGISFEEAQILFATDHYLEIFDDQHSEEEERFIAIGPISRGVVVVVWTETEDGAIRIISARCATKREARMYEGHIGGKYE